LYDVQLAIHMELDGERRQDVIDRLVAGERCLLAESRERAAAIMSAVALLDSAASDQRTEAGAESIRQRRARERVELRSARDEIRAHQPGQRRGPPDPDPLIAALDHAMSALAALRDQIASASSAPKTDDWIGQKESPIPPRCHARLCRELMARGDDRAALRGRTHYLRQSAIDEHLRGAPRPRTRVAPEQLSAGDRLLAELGGAR